tara:strand:- start:371 stop:556 length:186 start_codon:yes stop_codon:yes gene_type:complete
MLQNARHNTTNNGGYKMIDYKDAFNHIRTLSDLEWNGSITITEFRKRVDEIITEIIKKENK